jgi:transglutaminase-like putative cysteine protease
MAAAIERPATRARRAWQALRLAGAGLMQPQVSSAARERRDTIVLLAAVALVVVPHFEHLPWWATSLLLLLWAWRLWLALSRGALPGRFAMLPLLAGAAGAVWIQHGTLLGRDAGVTFLLLLMALKLLEMRARRDVFVVIFLCFFILLTQYLFSQGLPVAALTLVAVVLLFFVLVSANLVEQDLPAARKLRLVGLVLAKSLPLAAAMFVLFPRVSGPLWGLPGDSFGGRTGLSDSMSPGSISRLLEANEVAFRVQFDAAPPGNELLYWRGPVLGHFGGRVWSPLRERAAAPPALDLRGDAASRIDYTVTLEAHQRDWLFALEMPAAPDDAVLRPRLTDDAQLLARFLINERVRYRVRSYTRFAAGLNETPLSLRDWLQLPAGFNPRTLQLAAEIRAQVPANGNGGAAAPSRLVLAVLEYLRRGGFRYTLEPPLLGRHSVDEFLFETRQGFCEHYASAFVVLMRALDVPARVVTGYQGGELNPVDNFLTVRQSDAHAWAEVWLAGRGWVRVDPTAIVAPVRIERGATEIARQQGLAPLAGAVGQIDWLRHLRFNWEAVQNAWYQWVLSYSPERQREFLQRLGFAPDWRTLGWLFAISLLVLLSVLAVFSLRHRVERDPIAELFARFQGRLREAGVGVNVHEGPRDLGRRLEAELAPDALPKAREILQAFEQWRYSRASASVPAAAMRQLRRAVRTYRPRVA